MELSKSDYILFLKHPAWLWLKKHQKNLLPPIDENTQALFDAGHLFESYAEKIFKGEVEKLGFDMSIPNDYDNLLQKTNQALQNPPQFLLQARFKYEELTCICDVIEFISQKEINLYEIKSSTRVKPDHQYDLAFQAFILEKLGFTVHQIFVAHVNNSYIRHGEIDPEKLTKVTEVTEDVKKLRKLTSHQIQKALKTAASYQKPDLSPIYCRLNSFQDWLKIYKSIETVPADSILNLYLLNAQLLIKFDEMNITSLSQIPDDFHLSTKQLRQVQAFKSNQPIIDQTKIHNFLETLKFPIYFLDYETLASVIPPFDGLKAYQQLPFQYSLDVIEAPNKKLKHFEYIHQDATNPVKPLTDQLIDNIGENGSIVVWNMSFESSCNVLLAQLYPEKKDQLKAINSRIVDLMVPFSDGLYVDKDFQGSASIKKVLPVLNQKLSYKSLNISEGESAQRIWMQTFLDNNPQFKKEEVIKDLLVYCGLDTLAMVEIYNYLKTL